MSYRQTKYLFSFSILVFSCMFISSICFAAGTFDDFCTNSFALTKECSASLCALHCQKKKEGGCSWLCVPKPCEQISVKNCPIDYCIVLQGCGKKDVCYPRPTQDPPACGDLAYPYQDVECCEGLQKRCGVEFFDGSCDMEGKNSQYAVPVCLPCGNGTCNQFEDRCNCPEDCDKKYKPPVKPVQDNIAVDAVGNVERSESINQEK